MTYQNLGYWIGQANDNSTGRHPSGWASGQRWSLTASQWMGMYDSASASATTWQSRADSAWGPNRQWNNGPSFESQAWSGGALNNGQLWSTLYNNLLAGLNSPDGLQQGSYAISHNAGGTAIGIGTFTFARNGHFFVAVVAPVSGTPTQNNATADLSLSGVVNQTLHVAVGSTSGARNWWHAWAGDVDVTAGQTITLQFNAFVTGNPTTGTAYVYAHFVPNSGNHN